LLEVDLRLAELPGHRDVLLVVEGDAAEHHEFVAIDEILDRGDLGRATAKQIEAQDLCPDGVRLRGSDLHASQGSPCRRRADEMTTPSTAGRRGVVGGE